jgi:putative tryptophan/tyrosine transport system substrate-binding protein
MPHRTLIRLVTLALGFLVALLTAPEAQPTKVVRVGLLDLVNPRTSPFVAAFEQRLRALGYVEGQNLVLEFRTAEGEPERLPALAAELVQLPVDVLVAPGPEATLRKARQSFLYLSAELSRLAGAA